MGLGNSGGDGTWVRIKEGKFVQKVGENRELEFTSLTGKLTDLFFRDSTYEGKTSKQVVLAVSDETGTVKFSCYLSSQLGRSILFKLPNANLTEDLEFNPACDKEDPRKQTMYVKQFGANVKQKWTKENPGDLPPVKVIEDGGKKIYLSGEQEAWIMSYFEKEIIPKIKANKIPEVTAPASSASSSESFEGEEIESDIPF